MKRFLSSTRQLLVSEDHQALGNNCCSARTCLTIIRDTSHTPQNWSQNLKSKKWKCHFCHCQLMYHKSLWYLHNLPLARVKVLSEVLSDALHTNTMAMVNHNYFLGGFCGICSTGGKNSRAQIYGFLYMCKAIEFWQKGTSLDSTNTYK